MYRDATFSAAVDTRSSHWYHSQSPY